MKRFDFPLERLLELRRHAEAERARDLIQARHAEEARRRTAEEAAQRIEKAAEAGPPGVAPAGALHNLSRTVEALVRQAEAAEVQHQAAREAALKEQASFDEARTARRAVERLREGRFQAWHRETEREEQKNIDELALRRVSDRGTGE